MRPVAMFGAALMAVLVVGAMVALPLAGVRLSLPALNLGLGAPRVADGAPEATEAYMRGNRDLDASLVWGSVNDDVRSQMQATGTTVDRLQQQMQAARSRGYRVEDVSFIGSRGLPDGTSMAFYLVGVRQEASANLEYVPYLFTLDSGGKIARVQ